MDAIVSGLSSVGQRVKDAIAGAIDGVLGKIQSVIDAVRNALTWLAKLGGDNPPGPGQAERGPGSTGLGPPGRRAAGGPVSAGMPYIVGERGPELFVPGRSGSIVANGVGAAMAGGGVIENHIHVMLDGRELFNTVQKHAIRNMRQGGVGVPGYAAR